MITGAASEIGAAGAELFAAHGAALILFDQDRAGGQRVADAITARGGLAHGHRRELLEADRGGGRTRRGAGRPALFAGRAAGVLPGRERGSRPGRERVVQSGPSQQQAYDRLFQQWRPVSGCAAPVAGRGEWRSRDRSGW